MPSFSPVVKRFHRVYFYKACHSKTVFMLKHVLHYKTIQLHVIQPILYNVLSQNMLLTFYHRRYHETRNEYYISMSSYQYLKSIFINTAFLSFVQSQRRKNKRTLLLEVFFLYITSICNTLNKIRVVFML